MKPEKLTTELLRFDFIRNLKRFRSDGSSRVSMFYLFKQTNASNNNTTDPKKIRLVVSLYNQDHGLASQGETSSVIRILTVVG